MEIDEDENHNTENIIRPLEQLQLKTVDSEEERLDKELEQFFNSPRYYILSTVWNLHFLQWRRNEC